MRQHGHKKCHQDLGQLLWGLQAKLSECSAEKSTSCETCAAQRETAQVAEEGQVAGVSGRLQPH